jgi:signal transduction histidine kinase
MDVMETEIHPATGMGVPGFGAVHRAARLAYSRAQDCPQCDIVNLLAETEERLAIVSSLSTIGLWSWEVDTDKVWASTYTRKILGLDPEVSLSRDTLLGAIHPADRGLVWEAANATPPVTDTVEMELRVVGHEDGRIDWITAKATFYRDANGKLKRIAGYVIDDRERKRVEAESLRQQQQITHLTRVAMLGELSGALAHELQQPLTAILCNAQAAQLLAAKERFNVEELREILKDIVSDDKHAGEIIQHLRSLLIRGETKAQRLVPEELLRDVLVLARSTLKDRGVKVETRIEPNLPGLLGDRVELQQVLLNLVLNACESMSGNAPGDRRIEIHLATDEAPGRVRASVLDCGTGIDPAQLERVFTPFFTTKEGGMGLGLAVCHSIITAHKGRLWAVNRADRGAAFHFTLPVFVQGSSA